MPSCSVQLADQPIDGNEYSEPDIQAKQRYQHQQTHGWCDDPPDRQRKYADRQTNESHAGRYQ